MRDLGALHKFIADRASMPFEWGHNKNDCVSFMVQAVQAMTGKKLLGKLKWKNEDQANAVLNAAGGIEAAVSERLTEISPAFAQRGDVGAIANGNGLILVIVEGEHLVAPGHNGLRRLPRKLMVKAWSAE